MATLKAMVKLFDGYSNTIDKIISKTNEATDKLLKASGSIDEFSEGLRNAGTSANSASSGLGKFISISDLVQGAIKGMNLIDNFTNTGSRLNLINDGLQTQAELQEKLFQAANRSKGAYGDMANAVSNLQMLDSDTFTSNDEAIAFTELMQKSLKVGGVSGTEQSDTLLQLSQAIASGSLQGDEFSSISEKAPLILEAVSQFTGKSRDELMELASDGAITADIIKNSLFEMSDDINNKFENVPNTFSDIWNKIGNGATAVFANVMTNATKMINTDNFNTFVNGLILGFYFIAQVAGFVLDVISGIANAFIDNWGIISPIIMGIVASLLIYNSTALISFWNSIKDIGAKIAQTVAYWQFHAAIFSATLAQDGFNAALSLCPITWIIIAVIALIALFYALIGVINKVAGTSISATGIIVGVIAFACAVIWNIGIGLFNALIQAVWTIFCEPFIGIIEWILNAANGGFNSFGGAVANLIGQIISWFLSLGKIVTKIIDAIFNTDWTAGLSSLQDSVLAWGKNDSSITIEHNAPTVGSRIDYGNAYNSGYDWGSNISDKFSMDSILGDIPGLGEGSEFNMSDFGISDFGTGSNPLSVQGAGKNGSIDVNMADEDLKYLRDIAEREYINKFSSKTLAPQISVQFGDIRETADVDQVSKRITKILKEEIETTGEGVA